MQRTLHWQRPLRRPNGSIARLVGKRFAVTPPPRLHLGVRTLNKPKTSSSATSQTIRGRAMGAPEAAVAEKAHEKTYTVIVNAREKKVPNEVLSFNDVVALAEGLPSGEGWIYTVTFKNAENPREGTLVQGDSVQIKNGTTFSVSATRRS